MTDPDRLERLLRSALPPSAALVPSRDLWPSVLGRSQARKRLSWFDISTAAVVGIVLLMYPEWLWLLAYHL
jgi:hypothetical protein